MTSTIPRTYAYGELGDGTTWADVRVTLATKIQAERSMRANHWTLEANNVTISAFMSWHAARAAQVVPSDLTWEDFTAQAVDAGVTDTASTDDAADAADAPAPADPTR